MKIKDLDYYVKFIFSCSEKNVCFSTTDREFLKHVVFHKTGTSPMDYKIGDVLSFMPNIDVAYEITDIRVRQLVEDTEILNYGFDSEDCAGEPQGVQKDYLFSILFTMKPA